MLTYKNTPSNYIFLPLLPQPQYHSFKCAIPISKAPTMIPTNPMINSSSPTPSLKTIIVRRLLQSHSGTTFTFVKRMNSDKEDFFSFFDLIMMKTILGHAHEVIRMSDINFKMMAKKKKNKSIWKKKGKCKNMC